jgi:hypothetical protein
LCSLAAIPASLYVRSRQLPVRSSFYCLLPHLSLLGGLEAHQRTSLPLIRRKCRKCYICNTRKVIN